MQNRIILLLLVLATLVARADDVQKSTTATTKGARTVTVETYTRNGLTNLVVKTTSWQDRVWQDRVGSHTILTIQRVYHANAVALEIVDMGDGLTLSAKAGDDMDVGTHFTSDGKLDAVNLMTKDLATVDQFSVTNGILHPVPTSLIEKANAVNKDMKGLFDPDNVRTNSPDEFSRQAQELIEKHKSK